MAPPPHRAAIQRRRWLLLSLLALVTLCWILYPTRTRIPRQVWQDDPASFECSKEDLRVHNVAVIGAGSAGASAAYYLREFQSPCQRINITIYERNDHVGGRSTTVNAYDDPHYPVELGASIFVKVNHNLVNAAKTFGLPIKSMRTTRMHDTPEVIGVWNGEEFGFTQSDGSNRYWNIVKLLWKYGYSPIRTQNLMKKTVGSFLRMYYPPNFPFTSLSRTAFNLGLSNATAETGQQYLETNGVSEHFAHDIIQASTRVNYAQNLNQIHGLETMVCMATDGAMSIVGGNWQIFDGMIKASDAALLLGTTVTSITKDDSSGKYFIKTNPPQPVQLAQDLASQPSPDESAYDTIILASPLQFSNISFSPALPSLPSPIPYVSLHVTLFTSPYPLSSSYFNFPSPMPTTILTTTPPSNSTLPFFSISTLRTILPPLNLSRYPIDPDCYCGTRSSDEEEYLYKIFSPAPLNTSFIEILLDTTKTSLPEWAEDKSAITWVHEKRWDSYPYLPPRMTFEDLKIDWPASEDDEERKWHGAGIWYTSGIEAFISTMETSSLMGKNVARLVLDGWEMEKEEARAEAFKNVEWGCGGGGEPNGWEDLRWESEQAKSEGEEAREEVKGEWKEVKQDWEDVRQEAKEASDEASRKWKEAWEEVQRKWEEAKFRWRKGWK